MLQQAEEFERTGQNDLAQNILNVALQLLPEAESRIRSRLFIRRGAIAYRLKNTQGALEDFQNAIRLDPELAKEFSGDFSKYYDERCRKATSE